MPKLVFRENEECKRWQKNIIVKNSIGKRDNCNFSNRSSLQSSIPCEPWQESGNKVVFSEVLHCLLIGIHSLFCRGEISSSNLGSTVGIKKSPGAGCHGAWGPWAQSPLVTLLVPVLWAKFIAQTSVSARLWGVKQKCSDERSHYVSSICWLYEAQS